MKADKDDDLRVRQLGRVAGRRGGYVMDDADCRDPDLRVLLGFYAIGKLDDGERAELERHLAECAPCRADRDRVVPVVPALRLLGDTDIRELIEEFAVPAREPAAAELAAAEPAVVAPVPAASAAAASAAVAPGGAVVRPAAVRPPSRTDAAGVPSGGPDRRRQRRGRRRIAMGAVVVVAVAGVVTAFAVRQPATTLPDPAGIVASGDSAMGVTVSVTVVGRTVEATLTGLAEGVQYELYVVAADGRTFRLAELVGGSGVQQAGGDLPVPAEDLAFFSLRQADGAVVVTAEVPRPGSTPTPT